MGGEGKIRKGKKIQMHPNLIYLYPEEHFIAHKLLAIEDPTNPSNPHGLDVEPLPTESNPIVIHDDGTPVTPEDLLPISITDKDSGEELTYGEDFIIVLDEEGKAHIEFIDDYEGTDDIPLFYDVQTPVADIVIEEAPYTGEQIKPEVVVTFDGEPLVEGVDYTVTYGENINVGEDAGTVTITYIGDYSDIVPNTVELKFDIVTNNIDAHYLTVDYIEPMTYTGSQLTPNGEAVKVSYNGVTLTENVDYVLTYGENVHAGEGNGIVYIELIGGYSSENTKTVYFDILPKVVTDPSDPDTGLVITPTPDSENPIKVPPTEGDPDLDITIYDPVTGEELRNPEDYEVVIDDIEEGTAHIKFKGDYEGTDDIPVYFEVTEIVIDEIPDQPYTGEQSTPEPHITFDGEDLVEGEDYWVEYGDNDETGEGTIIIHYIGDFEDVTPNPKEITFTIEQSEIDVSKLDVEDVDDQNYTGSQIKPEPTVTYNGVELTAGKDFVYIYGENVHAGDDAGEITIRFIGGFDGEDYDLTFNILPKVISDPTNPDNPNGLDIEPLPTEGDPIVVPDNGDEEPDLMPIEIIDKQTGEELTNPEDFEIVIDDLEEGTAHIEFKGDYEGTPDIPLYFEVQEIEIDIPEQPYTGEPVTPEPIITFDGEELVEGIDYDVYYSNNTQPGKATATIVFKGDYAKIDPKQVEFGIMSTTLDNSSTTADGRSTVIVGYEEGFSTDITLYAVLQETVPDEIKNQASLGGRFYGTYGDYEIKLLDKDGNEVQPSDIKEGTVLTLMIELPEELQGRDVKIVHYHSADDVSLIVKGDKADIGTYVITEEGYLVTLINKFSNFSLIYEETCLAHWFMITAAVLNILLIGAIIIMGKKQSKIVGVAAIVGLAVVSGVGAVFAHCTICWVALGVNGLMILFDILFFAMWKGKAEPEPQPQVVQAQPQVVYVQAPAQAAPAPVAQPAPAPVDALSLKASIVKASSIVSAFVVTKELVASYLTNNYKDAVELNRKENYTSTNLPLADTHYVKLVDKKACFIYVYELKNNKSFFIVRTTDEIAAQIKEKHSLVELSAFPHTNDGAKWFTIMFDETYKCAEDVYEVIDLVLKGFLAEKVAPAPAPVEELSLHDQMEKAAAMHIELKANKEMVANYLLDAYKDSTIVNRKPNYTKTGLPLADTHYVLLGEDKKACFMYVYELNQGNAFVIVKTSEEIYKAIKAKHSAASPSAFPHTNDGGKWYSVMFDDSFKTEDDVHEVIDMVINGFDKSSASVKEEPKPVEPEPAPAPVVEEEMGEDGINYMYKFSFSARLIRAGSERQDFYNEIKNEYLSYKKVNSKISWGHELFKLGRNKLGQMKVKGKTLCVYLPLDPKKYDQERLWFKETGDEEFPMMMQVKSDRAVKYVKELIADVMANSEIPHMDNYEAQDYRLPEMTIEEMLKAEPPLAKLTDGAVMPKVEKKPEVEPKKVEKVEPSPVIVAEEGEDGIDYKYKFSFSARLIRAGADRQDFYNAVKNNFLSYKKVDSKISWGHELFKLGRIKLGLMKVKGKTLCVYLPLDPSTHDQDRLHFKDCRVEGKEVEFPLMMKVTSDRAIKYVAELVAEVMANNELPHLDDYEEVDYRLPEMSVEEMLKEGLAKENNSTVSFGK